jgi:hypothetical protein|tara:strand:+ start:143 stop:268 length:126 start_codon:yes stop_codon:yes gene_type:complete
MKKAKDFAVPRFVKAETSEEERGREFPDVSCSRYLLLPTAN